MGRFSKYLGKFDIKIGEESLELDVQMKDIKKFLSMSGGKGMDDTGVEKMTNTFIEIMVRSYPDEPRDEMEAFVSKHYLTFMNELFIAMGWLTRDDVESQKKKLIEKTSIQN